MNPGTSPCWDFLMVLAYLKWVDLGYLSFIEASECESQGEPVEPYIFRGIENVKLWFTHEI